MKALKNEYSNIESVVRDGSGHESRSIVCEACGKTTKSQSGLLIDYWYDGGFLTTKRGLCRACANRIVPLLEKAYFDEIMPAIEQRRTPQGRLNDLLAENDEWCTQCNRIELDDEQEGNDDEPEDLYRSFLNGLLVDFMGELGDEG